MIKDMFLIRDEREAWKAAPNSREGSSCSKHEKTTDQREQSGETAGAELGHCASAEKGGS